MKFSRSSQIRRLHAILYWHMFQKQANLINDHGSQERDYFYDVGILLGDSIKETSELLAIFSTVTWVEVQKCLHTKNSLNYTKVCVYS
jgi:hypothetical protein